MENTYGIEVKNKYDLFIDEDEDPYELLRLKEEAKKKREESKKEPEKGKSGKNKQSKKPVLQPETKNKQPEQSPPKKEGTYHNIERVLRFDFNIACGCTRLQKRVDHFERMSTFVRRYICGVSVFFDVFSFFNCVK